MESTSESASSSTLLNKILIPVITTVLGTTAIYFLGFNKKSGRSDLEKMLITKEATIKAWKSYVSSSNITYKNTMSLTEEYTKRMTEEAKQGFEALVPLLTDFQEEMNRESKKVTQDIEGILKKEEDIDPDFASMLNRALDNQKDQDKKINAFFAKLISLARSDLSTEEKSEKWQKAAEKFIVMGENVEERSANEAEGIAKTLGEKYGQPFDLNELLVYVDYKNGKDKKKDDPKPVDNNGPGPVDPNEDKDKDDPKINDDGGNIANNEIEPTKSLLTGVWEMKGGSLELSANGDMYWSFDTKGYTSGDWTLIEGKVQMNATNPDTKKKSLLVGFVSNFTRNSFTMTFMTNPREVYNFTRKN